ncbi:hypothetical protein IJ579_09025 [bacterium]|nr:hypothetical protein [bacterium]
MNRHSGARTCEPVCRAVSGSLSIFPSLDREGLRVGGLIFHKGQNKLQACRFSNPSPSLP